ncbi:MAG: putative glycoside hydrolase, partial [Oscillospiraceae bacterium]
MAFHSKEVYSGRHRKRNLLTLVLFAVAVVIVAAVTMFYSFQKYIVYGQNGISLELPILQTPAPVDDGGNALDFEDVNAELVIDEPDYSEVRATAGEDVAALKAIFVPAASVTEEGIARHKALMATYGANALVLEMRPESGQLAYASALATARGFGLSGTTDLGPAVTALKGEGVYLVAQISCCMDDMLASRNSSLALQNPFGGVYTDADGHFWLDPYSADVRNYVAELAQELIDMGFDEILLKYLEHPNTDETLLYSQKMSFTPTPLTGVSGFALSVSNALSGGDAVLSVVLDSVSLHNSLSAKTGQDPELFFKVFDRVCCWADSAWQSGIDRDALAPFITLGDAANRCVPIMTYAPEGAASWIIKVP